MLTKTTMTLALLSAFFQLATAQPSIDWIEWYGGAKDDEAKCIRQTSDHGFILVGSTASKGAGQSDLWLVKTNAMGKVIWERTFGGNKFDAGISILQTQDGGFIIAGTTSSFGNGNTDFWLLKTDKIGNELWHNTFGGLGNESCFNVCQTVDDGFILSGETNSFGTGGKDIWVIKTDTFGNAIWNRTFGGEYNDRHGYVQNTSDGGYILSGTTNSFGAGGDDFWLVKIDLNGLSEWDKTFGGLLDDECRCVHVTQDNGYIVTGTTKSFGIEQGDVWLIRTDQLGNKMWSRYYGVPGGAGSVCQTQNGGFIVAGWNSFCAKYYYDLWILITDAHGNRIWNEAFGSESASKGYSILEADDGGIIAAGSFGRESDSDACVLRVKSDVLPIEMADSQVPATFSLDQNYPNPFNSETVISYQIPVDSKVKLDIFDVSGDKVVTLVEKNQNPGYYNYQWNARGLPSGIYYYRIAVDEFAQVKKLTLLK